MYVSAGYDTRLKKQPIKVFLGYGEITVMPYNGGRVKPLVNESHCGGQSRAQFYLKFMGKAV